MTMAAAPVLEHRLTIDDVRAMPDGERYELVDGELVERHMSWESSWLGSEFGRRIGNFAAQSNLGFVSGPDNTLDMFGDRSHFRRADVSFTRVDRVPGGRPGDGDQRIPPDLVVEVVSPKDTARELGRKVTEYLAAGVRLTWVVYPDDGHIDVYRADGTSARVPPGGELSGEDVLPGFTLRLADILTV
jgi:Uma2 family endonuclease